MQREIRKSLFDILDAIDAIGGYLGERRDFNDYRRNRLLRRGVERELEIVGEAVNRILKLDPSFPIKNARQIVDMRNRVIHAYDSINDGIVWGTVVNHLPRLKEDVERLLG